MTQTLPGYPRCSTDGQDLTAQQKALQDLGGCPNCIYTDHGLNGTSRASPGLDQALAAVRQANALVVAKLDSLARSVPGARIVGAQLSAKGVNLALCQTVYDPSDPMGKMFFNIHAFPTFAEFEADLIRMPTRESMAVARAKGKLRGKQAHELRRMYDTGEYSVSDVADLIEQGKSMSLSLK